MAAKDNKLVGITPAMKEGSDLIAFADEYPDRYYDVAIAEQHSVALAAGLACEGAKPVVAIYSTFLQRAYDQLIHDVAIQNLDVTFAIDRSGLLEDGPTHSGVFDLSFLRCIPNLIVMAPADENEARLMLTTGYQFEGPAAIRYPRGKGPGVEIQQALDTIPIGKARILREGEDIAILSFGAMAQNAEIVGDKFNATVADMRFIKPLDETLLNHLSLNHKLIVTLEENTVMGGAGSAVNEYLLNAGIQLPILNIGVPDRFILQDKPANMVKESGLDVDSIMQKISERLAQDDIKIAINQG
jgi:1-deoxy-D-xylulose-5-phosphate synthase